MSKELKLWDTPDLAKSFQAKYGNRNMQELINQGHSWVIEYHVQNHEMVLSEAVKYAMKEKAKAKSYGRYNTYQPSRHY